MARKNILLLIVTSIICLLPICLSVAMYEDLPEKVIMQWNFVGNPNWYAHKAVIAFGMPLFFMIINIFLFIFISGDPKRENTSKVMRILTQWFTPLLSLFIVPLMLFMNMGVKLPIIMIVFVFVGLLFIFIGNYMPKNRQNYTIGIRLPWTLNNAENWNKTHRLAGILGILGGISFIVLAFLPFNNVIGIIVILTIIILMTVVPTLYSYYLYKKEGKV